MIVIKEFINLLKKLIHKIWFKWKLKMIDNEWRDRGGSCWGLFPPSFYYTHTEEEIKRITDETLVRLRTLIDEIE